MSPLSLQNWGTGHRYYHFGLMVLLALLASISWYRESSQKVYLFNFTYTSVIFKNDLKRQTIWENQIFEFLIWRTTNGEQGPIILTQLTTRWWFRFFGLTFEAPLLSSIFVHSAKKHSMKTTTEIVLLNTEANMKYLILSLKRKLCCMLVVSAIWAKNDSHYQQEKTSICLTLHSAHL